MDVFYLTEVYGSNDTAVVVKHLIVVVGDLVYSFLAVKPCNLPNSVIPHHVFPIHLFSNLQLLPVHFIQNSLTKIPHKDLKFRDTGITMIQLRLETCATFHFLKL